MEKIYLFDVDGTLTPPRRPMTSEFHIFFREWIKKKKVYLVSGSDYDKLQEQLAQEILKTVTGVFGCMGSTFHIGGHSLSRKEFKPTQALLDFLEKKLDHSRYVLRTGNHIEQRTGMVNFSIVGRNALPAERGAYHSYDMQEKERECIAGEINETFSSLEATVGGEISIDIYPKGGDKSQILKHIPLGEYVFFGDKTMPGGNDHALASALESQNHQVYPVSTYKETWDILTKQQTKENI